MTSSHPRWGQPAFRLAPDGWRKRTIFCNLLSFIRRTWPSYLNLSFIIALESGIEPHFSYNLLFEIRSVSQVPRTIRGQFLWKTSSKFSSAFRSVHASEPYFTPVITVASNILILVWRHLPILPNFLSCEKHSWALAILVFTSSLLPPSLLIILPR